MNQLRHIIAAVDFTPFCRFALKEAARRALLDGARLTAVHVMDDFLVKELTKALSQEPAAVVGEWQQRLEKFVQESIAGAVTVRCEVRLGSPFAELCSFCQAHEADLLVMGAKGSKQEPHRLGVIAAKCVRKSPVDVLVVREEALGPFKRIVACVDFSENSAKAVRRALHVAAQDAAALDCLHVHQSALAMQIDYGGFSPVNTVQIDPEAQKHWETELGNFLAPLTQEEPSVKTTLHVIERLNVRQTILEHVEQASADLVVLGTRGRSGLREMFIGTTAEKIIQAIPCSILAVKPDGFAAHAD